MKKHQDIHVRPGEILLEEVIKPTSRSSITRKHVSIVGIHAEYRGCLKDFKKRKWF